MRAHEDRIQDIGWIILSHQHIDRWGLARTVVGRSGAEVCALAGLEVWLRRYPASLAAEDAFAAELLRRHGRSGAVGGSAVMGGAHRGCAGRRRPGAERRRPARVRGPAVARAASPGSLAVRPVFHDEEHAILFSADHVMSGPSTPILSPPLSSNGRRDRRRPRALAQYRTSLRATAALELEVVLAGHGARSATTAASSASVCGATIA